jgi:hypothetical protein
VRAHYTRPVTDEQGNLLPNAQINVYDPATTTPISPVLYSTDTGSNVLSNPYVSSTGLIDFYLDEPTRVRIGVVQGGLPMQYFEDVDIIAAGSDSPHTGSGSDSLVIGVAATSAGDASVALGPSASSGGIGSTAVGSSTNAVGDYSAAVGPGASVSGVGGTAVGRNAQSVGDASTAVGNGAQTGAQSAMALGDGAISTFTHATAVGAGAQTTQANQVMLGTSADVVEIPPGAPVILSDSNGVRWMLTVDTDGSLDTEPA